MGRRRRTPGRAAEWRYQAALVGRMVVGVRAALGRTDWLLVGVAFKKQIVTVALVIGRARLGAQRRGCVIVEAGGGRRALGANKARSWRVLAVHGVRRADRCVLLSGRAGGESQDHRVCARPPKDRRRRFRSRDPWARARP